ncbi:MAG: geranylgeranyl reductase family protein, partial [Micromonosporaceae bacterium]|nr:geranylgeranyl reductase family protein [Micromonosporaceae bacterium]
ADVIVVGAGPGGSSVSFHLARHGFTVLLLEKAEFPREKICGDGLTPRAVKQLIMMGVDTSPERGWQRNRGLRVIGGGVRLQLDWPDLATFPDYGLTRSRKDLDQALADRAVAAGAILTAKTHVTGPIMNDSGRVVGVKAIGPGGEPVEYRAPLTIAADGVSGRFALSLGIRRRDDRPMGVAVRQYFNSEARTRDDYLESWIELYDKGGRLLPGYGWIFGLGDGRVNVGLGVLNSSVAFGRTNYRTMLSDWVAGLPADWGMADAASALGAVQGAALPMGFNRVPHYSRGVMLVGDCGGMVNPFNGEGIAYAMESGALAAEIAIQALHRPEGAARDRTLAHYPAALKAKYGGYYRLGAWFVKIMGHPHLMQFAAKYGMPRPLLMRFVLKLMANLTDPRDGDVMDKIINAMSKTAPSA